MDHSKKQQAEPDDPLVLRGAEVEGDPEVMLDVLIEEYARLGWDSNRIEQIFAQPFFRATFRLGERFGGEGIRKRIREILQRVGVFRFKVAVRSGDAADGAEDPRERADES